MGSLSESPTAALQRSRLARRRHYQVATERELEAAGHGRPVDGAEQRLGERPEREWGCVGVGGQPRATELLQVEPGAERRVGAGEDHHSHVGVGIELALGCDLLIASERARFADTHARVGVMPGWGLTVLLPQAIGIRRARQMSFTGNYVDAATALAWGLVNEVVPHEWLLDRAREIAADMATVPPSGLAAIKAAYRAASAPVDEPALDAEATYSRNWARSSFDPATLAASREAIQARGRAQQG